MLALRPCLSCERLTRRASGYCPHCRPPGSPLKQRSEGRQATFRCKTLARYGLRCVICGHSGSPDNPVEAAHEWTLSQGGPAHAAYGSRCVVFIIASSTLPPLARGVREDREMSESRCARCQRPNPAPAGVIPLDWEVEVDERGEVAGVICLGCLTREEQEGMEDFGPPAAE